MADHQLPPVSSPEGRDRSSAVTIVGLIVIAAVVLAIALWRRGGGDSPDAARSHPAVGSPIDDFELTVLTGPGETVSAADLRGKALLVSFWGTWCGYCVQEFPHLVKIAEDLKGREDFRWLPVTYPASGVAPPGELRGEVAAFLKSRGYDVTTYADPEQSLLVRAQAVGAYSRGFPLTILLDRNHRVAAVWNGYSPGVERQIERAIAELLE